MKTFRPETNAIQERFVQTRKELSAALIERDEEIDLVLTALVCREHPLLVGPPGCGKSLLLDSIMAWMRGRKFTILFTKFTTPEECFGPISVAGLKEDKYRRVTTGKLPEADGAFGDEIK
jgi:MoxR-like ATPase